MVASSYIIGKKSRVPYPPTNLIDGQVVRIIEEGVAKQAQG